MESILTGTWGGGPPPEEWVDYGLMKGMGWTFDELRATPIYVQQFCADFLGLEAQAAADQQDRTYG